uniref:Uncharacterized protein n=1 Tax=Dulem virus 188 TaxID=3145665 RepID=A0AAU8AW11_9VIRU
MFIWCVFADGHYLCDFLEYEEADVLACSMKSLFLRKGLDINIEIRKEFY